MLNANHRHQSYPLSHWQAQCCIFKTIRFLIEFPQQSQSPSNNSGGQLAHNLEFAQGFFCDLKGTSNDCDQEELLLCYK